MIVRRVLDTIRREGLCPRGARVLVGLSGGSDSVALLRLLHELEGAGELRVAGAAHLNHGLRPEADGDEQFCRDLAADLGVPFGSARADVRADADRRGESIEVGGRRARYAFYERIADELGADVVATGHTRDDQAETFLLRLIRGAGPRGFAGIRPRSGRIVRPLLDIGRDELRAYLAALGQPFREDASNLDVSIPRNRVRHELLPLLEARFSPGIREVLAREAAIARRDEARLHQEAIDLADSIVLTDSGSGTDVEVDARALRELDPALASRVALLALERVSPGRFIGFDHAERLLELARHGRPGASVSLPGQQAMRRGDTLVVRAAAASTVENSFRVSLSIPGEVFAGDWAISATPCPASSQPRGSGRPSGEGSRHRTGTGQCEVRVQGLTAPLVVRSRTPGDRLRPLGMGGRSKKLQDLFVDRKIQRELRDSLPLVVDGTDRIVWVVGEAMSEDFRVTEPSQAVIFLKARRLGGQG